MVLKCDRKKWLGRAALLCAAVFVATSSLGMLAACSDDEEEDDTSTTSKPDEQLLKNGDFEFFNDSDGIYYISTPDNWTKNSSGTSSYTASGVVSTSENKWDSFASNETAVKVYLDNLLSTYNADSDLDGKFDDDFDDYYIDYNGLNEYDLPYRDVKGAIEVLDNLSELDDPDNIKKGYFSILEDGDFGQYVEDYLGDLSDDDFISNPYTHDMKVTLHGDGHYYADYNDGTSERLYLQTDDDAEIDEDDVDEDNPTLYTDAECTEAVSSNVLMIHNYLKSGIGGGQYYSASTTITLEANTAAEISVWVKTSDLYYNGFSPVEQNRGAYIEVVQTVGGNTLDSFMIKDINTEKLNPADGDGYSDNGWVNYTIYVQACDFADTTITLNLGLGDSGAGACEGYAFFDDVEVTKYSTVYAMEEAISESLTEETGEETEFSLRDVISCDADGVFLTKAEGGNYCNLLNEGDEKVFEADYYKSGTDESYGTDKDTSDGDGHYYEDPRYSGVFVYYIDLTSSNEKESVALTADNLEVGPTKDSDDYAIFSPDDYDGALVGNISISEFEGSRAKDYYINTSLTDNITSELDILANIQIPDGYEYERGDEGFFPDSVYDYLLTSALMNAYTLPNYVDGANTIVMLSATGAAYTATVSGDYIDADGNEANYFEMEEDTYMIVSVWVKTSDMGGKTAATLRLVNVDDDASYASIDIDTTDIVTDIDDDNEDIYDGWVQCFFYVYNDTDETQTFRLEFQFGNTEIKDTTISSYSGGWAAFTNIQTLRVGEDEYAYTGSGTYTSSYTFSSSDNRMSSAFDSSVSDSDIKTNITAAVNYDGVNGASTSVIEKDQDNMTAYDYKNQNGYAGLINVDYFEDYIRYLFGLDEDADTDTINRYLQEFLAFIDNENYEAADEMTSAEYAWLEALILDAYNVSVIDAMTSVDELWREIFGSTSVQPLLIVDTIRTYTTGKAEYDPDDENFDEEEFRETVTNGSYYVYDNDKDYYIKVDEDNYDDYAGGDYTFYTIEQVLNYGYMSTETAVSSDSYLAITVKVKVVGDATAYIYLTDITRDRDVLSFEIPDYTFWYDDEGNVLIDEPSDDDDYDEIANIAYSYRTDGLYDLYTDTGNEEDGNYLYANMYSLTPVYMYESKDADGNRVTYYNEYGETVAWDNLESGVYYYADEDLTAYAPHYLVNSDGTRIFMYSGTGTGLDAVYNYYYYEEDSDGERTYKVDESYSVKTFNPEVAHPRYVASDFDGADYMYEIGNTNGEWVTVSFFIHTGSEEVDYRLELWSGERDKTGLEGSDGISESVVEDDNGNLITVVYPSDASSSTGYVIFDYTYVSLSEDTYSALMTEYTDKIIKEYQTALADILGDDVYGEFKSYSENIAYYENFILEKYTAGELTQSQYNSLMSIADEYVAMYYTFTLYDSASYYPFNEDMADDEETGYDYSIDDFEETLAYFRYNSDDGLYVTFVDYATVNQSIELSLLSEEEEEEEEESETNIWLLITSIVLVVALIVTLISMLVREIVKRYRRNRAIKSLSRNQYNKKKRFVRTLDKAGAAGGDIPDDVQ